MQNKELLIKILKIAGITEDYDKIYNEFEERLQVATQIDLRGLVSKDKLDAFEDAMSDAGDNKEKIKMIFEEYFTKEQIAKVYSGNINLFFQTLITSLFPNPTEEQITQLNSLVKG